MAILRLPPLDKSTPIVNSDGTPSEFFILAWQFLLNFSLSDLDDVRLTSPTNGQVLTYDGTEKKWVAL